MNATLLSLWGATFYCFQLEVVSSDEASSVEIFFNCSARFHLLFLMSSHLLQHIIFKVFSKPLGLVHFQQKSDTDKTLWNALLKKTTTTCNRRSLKNWKTLQVMKRQELKSFQYFFEQETSWKVIKPASKGTKKF